jgi:beta-glucosidase
MEGCRKFVEGTFTDEIGPGGGIFLDPKASTKLPGTVRQKMEYFNELQRIALTKTRLKIPLLNETTGTHGTTITGATIFPEGLAIGSTWDMDLVKKIYAAAAQEGRAFGMHQLDTLVVEPDRDPRMGRNMEGYSEDPYMISRIAESIVQGVQGDNVARDDKMVAVLTDFPGQSQPESGLERGAVQISERTLREVFLPMWVAGIKKAGALGVMAGYPEIDDIPTHTSEKLLTQILREELGFKGLVVSEGDGFETLIYENIVPTQKEAGAIALKAGVDVDITYEPAYMKPLIDNVEEGKVSMQLVDRAVRRVLEQKFRLGLFEHPYVDVDHGVQIMHSQASQDLALRTAREGIVLLRNEKNLLPLRKDLKSIAVIGPDADDAVGQLGDYTATPISQHVVTILEGIKEKVSPTTKITYAKGCDVMGDDKTGFEEAMRAVKDADAVVVVVGERTGNVGLHSNTDGEDSDIASLDLTGVQEELVKAVSATGVPTIAVLINGRPLSIRWISEHTPAIVEAWLPGERGGEAVADVIFGDYNPSGRLPISVPRHVGQLPIYYYYQPSKAYGYVDMPATPLYSFGHGLSYTEFEYSNLRLDRSEIHPAGNARVSLDVKNTGDREGKETVQLYVHETYAPVSLPVKQLRGFEKVWLRPGEKKTVTFTLTPEDLQLLDIDMHWRVVPGDFEIMVGKSSDDLPLKAILKVRQ